MINHCNIKNISGFVLIFLCSAFLLGGCASTGANINLPSINTRTTAAPPSETKWNYREEALNKIQSWHINGKIAVQTAKESGSATVDWRQSHNRYYVSLSGPMGSQGMKLSGAPGHVTLVTSDGKSASASSPEQLLAQKWGFRLPVSSLVYWVRGLPVPGKNSRPRFDSRNRLVMLHQEGWTIQYQDYTRVRNVDLPTRLYIYSSSLKTKLVIYSWHIG